MKKNTEELQWRVNTGGLIKEVFLNPGTAPLSIPFNMFGNLLYLVADRAAELNDDRLNSLMCRLALYEESDPYHKNYDQEKTEETIKKGMV